ncbi:hypothetical protein AB0395_04510 [Streptosporangium sp. NPDC051023]|uniref:DUF6461 domain-containing protein n=1 Tax=Streptosporangium sp. NPDC051023 TaxID=3155410 RepID=UPI00344D5567
MSIEEIISHYQEFLETNQWISLDQLCWTIVKERFGNPAAADVGEYLSIGGNFEVGDLEVGEGALEFSQIAGVFFIETLDGGYFLIQTNDDYASSNQVLRVLSREAQAWSIAWTGPQHRFAYAADGEVLMDWPGFRSSDAIYGNMPDALSEEVTLVREVCQRENWQFNEAVMMAVMEMVSGIRLNSAWFEGNQAAIIVRDII